MSDPINLASYIDHTILKPDATLEDILLLCRQAKEYKFASVCVNPFWALTAALELQESDVKVCTVVGFPLGANVSSIKVMEAKTALVAGAKEIDMVINIGKVKMQDEDYLRQEIFRIAETCKSHEALLKVILETALLSNEEKQFATEVCVKAGADFVKTSTGFSSGGATVEDVAMLKHIVRDRAKVKASGGIRTLEDALQMIRAGADRIGTSSGVNIVEEYLEVNKHV